MSAGLGKSAILNPTSKDFSRVDTGTCFLLVSCEDVTPYLDGYKVKLDIGNPLLMPVKGFTVKARWGARYSQHEVDNPALERWLSQLRTKDFQFINTLDAGRWNPVELIFGQTEARDIGYIEVSNETKVVSLGVPLDRR